MQPMTSQERTQTNSLKIDETKRLVFYIRIFERAYVAELGVGRGAQFFIKICVEIQIVIFGIFIADGRVDPALLFAGHQFGDFFFGTVWFDTFLQTLYKRFVQAVEIQLLFSDLAQGDDGVFITVALNAQLGAG